MAGIWLVCKELVAVLEFFLGWSLRNLNYTKFNKVIT